MCTLSTPPALCFYVPLLTLWVKAYAYTGSRPCPPCCIPPPHCACVYVDPYPLLSSHASTYASRPPATTTTAIPISPSNDRDFLGSMSILPFASSDLRTSPPPFLPPLFLPRRQKVCRQKRNPLCGAASVLVIDCWGFGSKGAFFWTDQY